MTNCRILHTGKLQAIAHWQTAGCCTPINCRLFHTDNCRLWHTGKLQVIVHCDKLQITAHCDRLQAIARWQAAGIAHCKKLQVVAYCDRLAHIMTKCRLLQTTTNGNFVADCAELQVSAHCDKPQLDHCTWCQIAGGRLWQIHTTGYCQQRQSTGFHTVCHSSQIHTGV